MDEEEEFVSVGGPLPKFSRIALRKGRWITVHWQGGGTDTVDLTPILASHHTFAAVLADDSLFCQAQIRLDGSHIAWPDGAELTAVWIEQFLERGRGKVGIHTNREPTPEPRRGSR